MIPIPFNEQFRLAVLEHFDVLDTQPEERFDRITRLAARCFEVPIAIISLVGDARQWFLSSTGLDVDETPREISFCGHAIMNREVFVVLDAAQDPRFAGNPLVTGEPGIRFYAGAPLVTESGFRLGTLCLIDRVPHEAFGAPDRATLTDLAELVMEEMYRGVTRAEADAEPDDVRPSGESGGPNSGADHRTFEQVRAQEAQLLFIASLSHELRTPLNAIVGFSEALKSELFGPIHNDRYLDYASHINASGLHLARFVDSVLDFVKAEKGEVSARDDWVDVGREILTCRDMFTEQLRTRRIRFRMHAPDDLPLLKADPQMILQMLVNLVGNSIKFTEAGGTIQVTARIEAAGGLALSVEDTGIGIAAEDLPICQAPFGRANNALSRECGGTGLGLSLTKRFMELHDGELAMESRPGVGTTVRLHFPPYRVE